MSKGGTGVGVTVALVGYGSSGRGIHAPLLTRAGVAPCIVVTGDGGRAAAARAELPAALVVPHLDDALSRGPDLVVLASPSGVHAEQAHACIDAGVAVVVDKPLATDRVHAGEVVGAAADAGVALTVFQNRRWDGENRTLARLLSQGSLGAVHRFERRWERWRPVPKDRWRENASPSHGGGILLDLGTHLVDAAVHLFGPVVSVYAEIAARSTPAEDEAFLALEHRDGVRSHLSATSTAGAPGPRTRVLAARGSYVVTDFEAEQAAFRGFEDTDGACGWLVAGDDKMPVPAAPGGHGDFYPAVLSALGRPDAQARQSAMPVDPRDAVHVLAVLDAARISASERRVVTLAELRPA